MAVRHVKAYIDEVNDQYNQMLGVLHELEDELSRHVVSPEVVDRFKATMEPIKINRNRLEYIFYLLNKPNKKPKEKRYIQQNKKLIKALENGTKSDVLREGESTLNSLEGIITDIRNNC